jgi:hypothetical protein
MLWTNDCGRIDAPAMPQTLSVSIYGIEPIAIGQRFHGAMAVFCRNDSALVA